MKAGDWLNPELIARVDVPIIRRKRRTRFQGGSLQLQKNRTTPDVWYLRYITPLGGGKRQQHCLKIGNSLNYPSREDADKAADVFRKRIREGHEMALRSAPVYEVHGKAFYTKEQYQEKLISQNGKCAICRDEPPRLHFDHDHATGALRDLLCSNCNRAIGMFKDNPSLCESAANYLRKHGR
jgi:hypothetical protein